MGYIRFLLSAAAAATVGLTLIASEAGAASLRELLEPLRDPHKVEALTSPAPNQTWVPDQPLPTVPAPTTQQPLPPELSRPLSLAELTELALRLSARTRQAWFQARAEAAALGIERADDFPELSAIFEFSRFRTVSNSSGRATAVQNNYGPTVSLSYVLYDFGQGDAAQEAAS